MNNNNIEEKDEFEGETLVTLTDVETGEEKDFYVLATAEIDGKVYYALQDSAEEVDEYFILRANEEGEDIVFETIDSDEEFEAAEDYFNDLFFNEMDYDAE